MFRIGHLIMKISKCEKILQVYNFWGLACRIGQKYEPCLGDEESSMKRMRSMVHKNGSLWNYK